MSVEASALVLAWVTILFLALAMTGLIRQVRTLSTLVIRDQVSARPSSVVGQRPPGLDALVSAHGSPLGIVFASDGCSLCEARLEEIGELRNGHSVIVIRRRPVDDERFPEVADPDLFEAFRVTATPMGFMVGLDGVVAEALPLGSPLSVARFVDALKEEVSDAQALD